MRIPSSRPRRGAAFGLVLLLAAVTPVTGQTSRPAVPSARGGGPAEADRGLLAGPRVSAEAMLAPERPGRRAAVPMRRWVRLLRQLDLTPSQSQRVREIVGELETARREFRRVYGDEADTLRSRVRSARRNQTPVAAGDLRRLRELRRFGPDVTAFQQRIWDELDPTQRDSVRRAFAGRRPSPPPSAAPPERASGGRDRAGAIGRARSGGAAEGR